MKVASEDQAQSGVSHDAAPYMRKLKFRQINPRLPVLDALPLLNQAAAIEMEAKGASPFWARIMRAHAILEDALAKEAAQ
jgi:hypothetical protein